MLASSVTSQISAEELTAVANVIQSDTYRSFEVYVVVAVVYLALSVLYRFAFWLITLIFGNRIVKVSWNEIEYITSVIRLKKPAGAYGLMKTERRFGAAVSKVPFA